MKVKKTNYIISKISELINYKSKYSRDYIKISLTFDEAVEIKDRCKNKSLDDAVGLLGNKLERLLK